MNLYVLKDDELYAKLYDRWTADRLEAAHFVTEQAARDNNYRGALVIRVVYDEFTNEVREEMVGKK